MLSTVDFSKMQLLVTLDHYSTVATNENLILTIVAVFTGLWIYEKTAYVLYGLIGGEVFGPAKHRVVLARHTMDLTSMLIFCYMGYESLEQLGGLKTALSSVITSGGKVASLGAERAFAFSSAAQRLCAWQVAYEIKNFCDSVIHNDGVLFLAHHTATATLAVRISPR
jgi:hypothetical protein